jgi:hypothetical protein
MNEKEQKAKMQKLMSDVTSLVTLAFLSRARQMG